MCGTLSWQTFPINTIRKEFRRVPRTWQAINYDVTFPELFQHSAPKATHIFFSAHDARPSAAADFAGTGARTGCPCRALSAPVPPVLRDVWPGAGSDDNVTKGLRLLTITVTRPSSVFLSCNTTCHVCRHSSGLCHPCGTWGHSGPTQANMELWPLRL